MEAVTISSKYQVVIPREVRKRFNIKPGQKILFIPYNGTLRVIVVPLYFFRTFGTDEAGG